MKTDHRSNYYNLWKVCKNTKSIRIYLRTTVQFQYAFGGQVIGDQHIHELAA